MGYTSERNTQIIVSLLKYHNIKKIVVSPGANNVSFVASVQQDSFFEIYSSVDERSAGYIACGLAAGSGEPVVITCTGATASRNYFSALTEAYYRHLPILAITYTQPVCKVGHNVPQVIDRTVVSNDIAKLSVHIPMVKDKLDEWQCTINVNEAILELFHRISGPVHMNVETMQSGTFDIVNLPYAHPIDRLTMSSVFPHPKGKVAVFVGSHPKWSASLCEQVDEFCEKYNAVVICDHTSNYKGNYAFQAALISTQYSYESSNLSPDILIHMGDISGAYYKLKPRESWRVSNDGALCDNFSCLRYVFEMEEIDFFKKMNSLKTEKVTTNYYVECMDELKKARDKVPELPFSNLWVANKVCERLPEDSELHLGILNSLRSFNFYDLPKSVNIYSNTGGFGIDGCVSTMLGACLASPDKLIFGVVGDLAFFYDMNVLGNRDKCSNFRLMVINNGLGQEFKNYGHRAAQFAEKTDEYIAAAGHYGNQSRELLKQYAENLGYTYLAAHDPASVMECLEIFLTPEPQETPMVFEVFTDTRDETEALRILSSVSISVSGGAKMLVKNMLGDSGVQALKKIIKK